jgi:hypothetical protein
LRDGNGVIAGCWKRLQLLCRQRFRWFRGRQSRICGQKITPDTCLNAWKGDE